MNESIDFEVWKCLTLVRMIIKKGGNPEMALSNYSKNIYEKSLSELKQMETNNEKQN